jgi:hypothetical protein
MADAFAPLRDLFLYVSELESSVELRGSLYVAPWITVFHVISIVMFAGTILTMDLRLLGRANMQTPFSQVQRRLFPWQMAGMAMATFTGLALVFANPMNYFANIIFWTKMSSMAIAGFNALAFHFITEYTVVRWDTAPQPPFGAQLAGGLSVLLWINVVIAGRLIPYATTWVTEVV